MSSDVATEEIGITLTSKDVTPETLAAVIKEIYAEESYTREVLCLGSLGLWGLTGSLEKQLPAIVSGKANKIFYLHAETKK